MSKFCTNCGATLNDDARFCTECGATLEAAAAQSAAAAAPPPPPPQAAAPVMQAAPPPQAAPAAEKPKKKKKERPVYEDYDAPAPGSKYAPISTWGYIGISLLACIPIVGFILLIVWAFGGCKKINKRNFARAMLIMMAIGLVFSLISGCAMKMVFDKAVDAIEEESGISVSALMGKDNGKSGKSGKNSKSDDKEDSSGGLGDLGALAGLLGGSSKDNDDAA
ncbi:MAG: zinc ribbon domain-containing protein, partial [Oscillospiraceae bacterium]|nr:zinc ribbon domain-containing protein [Oscillospiraceae bacterium]